jgi:CubicO group peptidase (beta-lactamase class C family)
MQPIYSSTPLLSLVCLVALPAPADQVDDYIHAQMAERRIPGVALTIIQNGNALKTAAYGLADLEQNVPVTTNTAFEIGSITKQFTAAGILLLQQEGKLSVTDKISKFLNGVPDSWTNITIKHLLTHTSGIKNYTGLTGFELTRHLTQKQFIDEMRKQPLDFEPGESWKYCNTGYNLLGLIIENVSTTNYWAYMNQKIFRRLGMSATTDRRPSTIIPNRAHGYEQTNRTWINRDYDLTDVFSAGAIVSTVGDLAKWNTALDRDDLLNAASKDQMWTVAKLNSGKPTKYGLGWYLDIVEKHKNIGHGGSTSGFSATIQRFPDDHLTVIILTNTDEQIATTIAKKIAIFYFPSKP